MLWTDGQGKMDKGRANERRKGRRNGRTDDGESRGGRSGKRREKRARLHPSIYPFASGKIMAIEMGPVRSLAEGGG
ncbi:hypothetical protein niasHT_035638 [Heterodera trifolii]|uniref:Uncharacterized protein n=1 Tax=Heterodera trifolii TaxID=157864 RepID=A0ABD2HV48_9BILA